MGFIVILINLAYLVFSLVVGGITYYVVKNMMKKHALKIAISVFLITLLAPFWDLLIQKGIKTYYEVFKMDYTIHAYPEKDELGRVESLGVVKKVRTTSSFLESQKASKYLKNTFEVSKYLEIYLHNAFIKIKNNEGETIFKDDFDNDVGYARVYFNQDPISYKKIKDETEFNSRYQVLAKTTKYYFYNETIVEFWDKKRNTLLATAMEVNFPVRNGENKFRTKYLVWWINAGGGVYKLQRLRNYHTVFKSLFGYSITTSKI